jgi:TolB-like protein
VVEMSRFIYRMIYFFILVFFFFPEPISLAQSTGKPKKKKEIRIGVMEFENHTSVKDLDWLGKGIQEYLQTRLPECLGKDVSILERSQIDKVKKEVEFQQTKFVDPRYAVKLGRMLGVNYVILGSYQQHKDKIMILARRVDVERNEVYEQTAVVGESTDLFALEDKTSIAVCDMLKSRISPEIEGVYKRIKVEINVTDQIPLFAYHLFDKLGIFLISVDIENQTGEKGIFEIEFWIEGVIEAQRYPENIELYPKEKKTIFINPVLPTMYIRERIEREEETVLRVRVFRVTGDGKKEVVGERDSRVYIWPPNRWFFVRKNPNGELFQDENYRFLAVFVTPDSPALNDVIVKASERGKRRTPPVIISGVQGQKPFVTTSGEREGDFEEFAKGIENQVRVVYETLVEDYGIIYLNQPDVIETPYAVSQLIRFPVETLKQRGNCIELAVLFSALLERIEIPSILIIYPGHAVAGWEVRFKGKRRYYALETNLFGKSFEEVLEGGRKSVEKHGLNVYFENGRIEFKNGLFSSDGAIVLHISQLHKEIPPSPFAK